MKKISQIQKRLKKLGKEVRKRFFLNNYIKISHHDGSLFVLHRAEAIEEDGIWYVFTEHNGDFFFFNDDLVKIYEELEDDWREIKNEKLNKKIKKS